MSESLQSYIRVHGEDRLTGPDVRLFTTDQRGVQRPRVDDLVAGRARDYKLGAGDLLLNLPPPPIGLSLIHISEPTRRS